MSKASHKILCIMPNQNWTVGEIRLRFPLQRMHERNPNFANIAFRAVFDLKEDDFTGVKIVIIQRHASAFTVRLAKLLREANIPYIYEIDDLLWDMPAFLDSSGAWGRRRNELFFLMHNAAHITTTTKRLANKIKGYNPNVAIIPNACPQTFESGDIGKDERPVILLAATDTIYLDHIIPALKKVQNKTSVPIVVVGPIAKRLRDADLQIEAHEVMEYAAFFKFIRKFTNAVALLPLDASDFSSCKSPVKLWSYIEAGIPVLADNLPPYSDVIKHGVNGWLVERNGHDWEENISSFLHCNEQRERVISCCRACTPPSLDNSARCWHELMESILLKRDVNKARSIQKLPSSWDWSHLKYLSDRKKYRSLLNLMRQNRLHSVFTLLRKGM